MALKLATETFLRKAQEYRRSQEEDTEALLQSNYEREVERIDCGLQQYHRQEAAAFIPPLYRRRCDPAAEEVLRLFRQTSKLFELNLRFRDIEKLDETHENLWKLLGKGGRTHITLQEYEEVVAELEKGGLDAEDADVTVSARAAGARRAASGTRNSANSVLSGSQTKSGGQPCFVDDGAPRQGDGGGSEARSRTTAATPGLHWGQDNLPSSGALRARVSNFSRGFIIPTHKQNADQPSVDHTMLGEMLYLPYVDKPRLTLGLFLSCPCSAHHQNSVDVATIYQMYVKRVSFVKCEAELLMWDTDGDGKLTEDEMESYVRDLALRIAALQNMPEADLPFYSCTVTRRIFWDLDQGNRGVIRIGALLRSVIMDEWVTMQLQSEDSLNSWFGVMTTQQLYAKFLLLDTRNVGTLDAASLKLYKKGLPTIIDDGLPLDVSPLSSLFVDRYFETNIMTANREMDYRRFVDFVIAVEMLPQCSRPVFWWDILDLEGTGVVTPLKANFFFKETHAKLVFARLDVPSIETVIQEAFDLIQGAEPLRITREEFITSPQAGLFAGMLVDCLSFWAYETREHR